MIILLKNIGNEFRPLSKIAGPLIVNNLSIAGMQFADTIMSGMLGAESLAAVAVGSQIWFLGFMVSLGLMKTLRKTQKDSAMGGYWGVILWRC